VLEIKHLYATLLTRMSRGTNILAGRASVRKGGIEQNPRTSKSCRRYWEFDKKTRVPAKKISRYQRIERFFFRHAPKPCSFEIGWRQPITPCRFMNLQRVHTKARLRVLSALSLKRVYAFCSIANHAVPAGREILGGIPPPFGTNLSIKT
jgi:hypothetical protein